MHVYNCALCLQLWEAIEEIQDTKKWKIESVPEYVSDLNEAKLAASTPGVLRDLEVPTQPPCLKSYAALSSPQVSQSHVQMLLETKQQPEKNLCAIRMSFCKAPVFVIGPLTSNAADHHSSLP